MPALDLGQLPLVDTHERLRPASARAQSAAGPLTRLLQYDAATDLQTAGQSRRAPSQPVGERGVATE